MILFQGLFLVRPSSNQSGNA